jgi:hypothetical protein
MDEEIDFLDFENQGSFEQDESETCSLDDDECVSCGS